MTKHRSITNQMDIIHFALAAIRDDYEGAGADGDTNPALSIQTNLLAEIEAARAAREEYSKTD